MSDLIKLQTGLGLSFNNIELLHQAFIHSSYVNEHPRSKLPDNERLEFLGDAILNFVITELIYQRFTGYSEGRLTEIRSILNREETLSQIATDLNLGEYLIMSKGEKASGGDRKKSNLANLFEALLGAIYLDQGLSQVESFIAKYMESYISLIQDGEYLINYKGLLQEYTQAQHKKFPVYQLISSEGPDHEKSFTVEAILDGKVLGKGTGKSKRLAEMAAAKKAYKKLQKQ